MSHIRGNLYILRGKKVSNWKKDIYHVLDSEQDLDLVLKVKIRKATLYKHDMELEFYGNLVELGIAEEDPVDEDDYDMQDQYDPDPSGG